jgi:hypothetical protein
LTTNSNHRPPWTTIYPRVAAVLLIVLGILATATSTVVAVHERQSVDCQTTINNQFIAALRQRADAADTERQAQRALFDVILNPKATPDARKAALAAYAQGLAQADDVRGRNPLPTGTCN